MYKTTVTIDGMACRMCEAHVNEAIRKSFNVKKVTSSFKKGTAEIISNRPLSADKLRELLDPTGYMVTDVKSEEYVKRGLFG